MENFAAALQVDAGGAGPGEGVWGDRGGRATAVCGEAHEAEKKEQAADELRVALDKADADVRMRRVGGRLMAAQAG